ncbi:MAG TPA: NAD(P)/FAD-dependent oxidoreductase [Pyrinomonadaceae bacterium]|nr:NAD(P)/FAD-dependent oxidoreductase [Pyrinomonadaceae bacterium]
MTDTSSVDYDGIILGAGHNGLILQSYLGMAGLKVLSVERRAIAGGGLTTEEDPHHPGFFHNTHSFFHRGVTQMPWYQDLKLERYGVKYIEPELNVALVLQSGETLEWWTDFEKTYDSFASFSSRDAATLRRWRQRFIPIVNDILIPESRSPPIEPDRRRALLEKTANGKVLLEVAALSPLEFVKKEFEHPLIQAGLLFFNGLREVDPCCKGFGHHIPALLASAGKAQMCVGGSANLARGLTAVVRDAGGEVRLQVNVRRILVDDERVVGIELDDGEVIRARHFVASSLNPQQTFLDLLDEGVLPQRWRDKAEKFRYNLLAPLFGLYLDLEASPRYAALEKTSQQHEPLMVILGLEHLDQFSQIMDHHVAGTIPPTVMWGSCPTRFDPTQAPTGKHTAFMWEKLPYRLNGDPHNWDEIKQTHGRQMLSHWRKYAPNLETSVIDWFTRSPFDTERTFPNMRNGDLLVGAFTNGQYGYNRPFPGAGHYRGYLKRLYLCGSSSHPGGNITGLPGYNCAQVILADLGLPAPWAPSVAEERLSLD